MKRISAYQATDGQVFPDKVACREHQKNLNIIAAVEEIANRFDSATALNEDEIRNDLRAEVAMFILQNAEEIQAALAGKISRKAEV